ncbi:MAG: response regulator [candidate division NC10 bacterium]|nr:response regulator [candidate division NC10 bacterium]
MRGPPGPEWRRGNYRPRIGAVPPGPHRPCHAGNGRLDLLGAIRRHGQTLPVVFLSAFGDRATMVQATEMGAVDFLTKAFRADSLLGLIQRIIPRQSGG